MKTYASAWTAILAAFGLAAGAMTLAGAPTAEAKQTCNGKPVTIVIDEDQDDAEHDGTPGDDVVLLKGSAWYAFFAGDGDDTICSVGHGTDVVGESGDDWISGQGAETEASIVGGPGDDVIIGSESDDEYAIDDLYGGPGNDKIYGLAGEDKIYPDQAASWDDKVTTDGVDEVYAGPGKDTIEVSMLGADKTAGADKLDGGSGRDALVLNGKRAKLDLEKKTLRTDSGGPTDRFNAFNEYHLDSPADVIGNKKPNYIWIRDESVTGIRVDTKGGADRIDSEGTNATIDTGSGDDVVHTAPAGRKNRVELGRGDDQIMMFGSLGTTVEGGPGDDKFQVRLYGPIGDDDYYFPDLLPLQARLKGQSGSDTLSWDCKSTVDVAKNSLKCKKADVWFGGMQVYKASRNRTWQDEFHGSSRRDVFYGGDRDDVMYGRGGNDKLFGGEGDDYANGGPGKDTCKAETTVRC